MREISVEIIGETIKNLFLQANTELPQDVRMKLEQARCGEQNKLACFMLDQIIENAKIASDKKWPLCQDTGMAVIFIDIGQEVSLIGRSIEQVINENVAEAYRIGGFRNSVASPITRLNTNNNTPAIIHYNIVPGDKIHVYVAPKGFGSENMSRAYMLTPTAGANGVLEAVVETVKLAGGNPCPPLVIGIGIGGTLEKAALLAKRSLVRPIGQSSSDRELAALEERALQMINGLNIGPQGVGGQTTAIAVHMLAYPTHIAGLPVVINIQCHSARHAEAVI